MSALLKRRKQRKLEESAGSQCLTVATGSINLQPLQPPGPPCVREERRRVAMAVPVRRCCLCSHTRAHLENGPPGRWALSSRAGRQPEELEPFSARREAQVGHWKGCQLLDGNAISSTRCSHLGKFQVPSTNEKFLLQTCFGGVPAYTQAVQTKPALKVKVSVLCYMQDSLCFLC